MIGLFNRLGVETKTERGGRVFPVSDHSSDVIQALKQEMERLGVRIRLHSEVKELLLNEDKTKAAGLLLTSGQKIYGDAVIVATGGISYPSTGSTGDGYRFARESGHQVTDLSPSLVPMEVKEWYAGELMGLSLRNVEIRITDGKKKLYQEFGEMLFTHYGVTGPVILSASSIIGKRLKNSELTLHIDLKPALTEEQLDKRILREFEANHNRQFKNSTDRCSPQNSGRSWWNCPASRRIKKSMRLQKKNASVRPAHQGLPDDADRPAGIQRGDHHKGRRLRPGH